MVLPESLVNAVPGRQAGRHVLVTGAGTGIGKAIALRLAAEGADVSLLARDRARLEATASEIAGLGTGGRTHVASLDVTDRAAVDREFDAARAALGPLHVLVANAGIGGENLPGPDDRFDELVATNLVGTYSCLRAAQRNLADERGARHLVAVSSVLSRFGVPAYTGYCASKTGVNGLVRALAMELAADDVQVNAVCPGWVDTAMAREGVEGIAASMGKTVEEALPILMERVPLGRMSQPEDVAGLVAWLVSPDARGVTGQCLDINGGAWMG